MPSKVAFVIYEKCRPELCPGGVCQAALVCKRKILTQEKPGDMPVPSPSTCASYSDCVRACLQKAIKIVVM
jgi:translation initiation factor RLI1